MKNRFLLFALILLSIVESAYGVTIDGINYNLYSNGKRANVARNNNCSGDIFIPDTVVYNGEYYEVKAILSNAFKGSGVTSARIPNTVTYMGDAVFGDCTNLTTVTIGNSVTSIGLSAFDGCTSLTSIIIPNSVKTIGWSAFYNCSNLTSIVIGDGVTSIEEYAFYNCIGLTSITIPNSVTEIGEYAFRGCTGLTSVVIPNSVTILGGGAFYDCSGISSVEIPETVTIVGSNPFKNTAWYNNLPDGLIYKDNVFLGYKGNKPKKSLEIKAGTRIIAGNALYGCDGLNSVTIPNSVVSIGISAFASCGLTSISIPNSVISIEDHAFDFCSKLKSVTLGNSLKSIGLRAFGSCEYLTSITIPTSVTTIGEYAFLGCRNLSTFTISNSVTSIGEKAFFKTAWYDNLPDGLIYKDDVFIGYKGDKPQNVLDIEDGTRLIAGAALDNCDKLTAVTIPNSVICIGDGAFYRCEGLTSIIIGNSVKTIGYESFCGCSSISSITIPNSVTSIGEKAFSGCSRLKEVISQIEQPYPIGPYAFGGECYFSATLFVPEGTKNQYLATEGWYYFSSIKFIGEVTLKAKNCTRMYGEENPTFEYEVTEGSIESGAPIISCSATKYSPVGTYDITIEKGSITNNRVHLVNGTMTITKAPLTISAGNYTKEVGEENPPFTPTFNGFKNDDTKGVLTRQPTVSSTATKNSPAGIYPVTVSGAEAQNYSISYESGTLTIKEKPENIISFLDANIKAICIKNWDTNDDGELSKQEAALVKDLETVFQKNKDIKSFNELFYFTGLTSISKYAFYGCSALTAITIPSSVTSLGQVLSLVAVLLPK